MKCQHCKENFPKGYEFAYYKTKRVCQRCNYRLKKGIEKLKRDKK